MSKKRTRLQIIHDILSTLNKKSDGVKPTHVLYKSNLSHQMMEEYFKDLIKKNFIGVKTNGKNKLYFITDRGRDYLTQYKLITNFTDTFGLDD